MPSFKRTLLRLGAALLLAGGVMVGSTWAVAAECNPPGTMPSFRMAVTTATMIVVGEVVAVRQGGASSDGRSSRFIIRVDHVLRGGAPPMLNIVDVATQSCGPTIMARPGDVIAIAFDVTGMSPPFESSVAWIRGIPVEGAETVTVPEAFRLAGRQLPGTSPPAPHPARDLPIGAPLVAVGVVAGFIAVVVWQRRRLGRANV